jgi:hypothetical protein
LIFAFAALVVTYLFIEIKDQIEAAIEDGKLTGIRATVVNIAVSIA